MSKRAPGGLSSSAEDYIKAILQLTRGEAAVRVTDLANKLGIAKSSVTEAMMALKERGLVTQERYGRIFLTAEGLAEAERIRRRHLVFKRFFAGYPGRG